MATRHTATDILDVAERLVQQRGFNGFSYADVANELGITKAALHYHFAGKAELGEALMARYTARFADALAVIDARVTDPAEKLEAYAALYVDVLRGGRMCLCGMLASDYEMLPVPMRDEVVRFFDENEAWLTRVLNAGRRRGSLRFAGPAREVAATVLSSLEGAMLVARPYRDVGRLEATARTLVDSLRRVP